MRDSMTKAEGRHGSCRLPQEKANEAPSESPYIVDDALVIAAGIRNPGLAAHRRGNLEVLNRGSLIGSGALRQLYFFSVGDGTLASRKNLADSSGGVGLI